VLAARKSDHKTTEAVGTALGPEDICPGIQYVGSKGGGWVVNLQPGGQMGRRIVLDPGRGPNRVATRTVGAGRRGRSPAASRGCLIAVLERDHVRDLLGRGGGLR
jgi:hypothetical protein